MVSTLQGCALVIQPGCFWWRLFSKSPACFLVRFEHTADCFGLVHYIGWPGVSFVYGQPWPYGRGYTGYDVLEWGGGCRPCQADVQP